MKPHHAELTGWPPTNQRSDSRSGGGAAPWPRQTAAQFAFSELFELNCPNCDGWLASQGDPEDLWAIGGNVQAGKELLVAPLESWQQALIASDIQGLVQWTSSRNWPALVSWANEIRDVKRHTQAARHSPRQSTWTASRTHQHRNGQLQLEVKRFMDTINRGLTVVEV